MMTFILISLLVCACIYHGVRLHQLQEEHDMELSAARRKQHDLGFSKGWAQCHQAMSLRMENTEELRLQARRSQLAMEAANARLKYFDQRLLEGASCSCRCGDFTEVAKAEGGGYSPGRQSADAVAHASVRFDEDDLVYDGSYLATVDELISMDEGNRQRQMAAV